MISITSLKVTGFSRRYHDVQWEIAPTNDDLQEWTFTLERSEAEAGPFTVVAGPLVDRYWVRDNATPQISLNRTLFYRVYAQNKSRQIDFYSQVADREGPEDLIAAEIGSLETLLFEEFVGTRTWLFPKRTFGQRCAACWDDVMGKKTDDSCPVCFNTGFSGGFHWPVEFFAQFDSSPRVDIANTMELHQQVTRGVRCPASPHVSPGDLLINHQNRRYRVVSVADTNRLGVSVHQELHVIDIQPGSIEDAIELKVEHRSLDLVAHRNFTNPQCPESAGLVQDDALSSLLGRYG